VGVGVALAEPRKTAETFIDFALKYSNDQNDKGTAGDKKVYDSRPIPTRTSVGQEKDDSAHRNRDARENSKQLH
jgi:hypothetical protein